MNQLPNAARMLALCACTFPVVMRTGSLPRLAWCSLGSNPAAAAIPAPPADMHRVRLSELTLGSKLGQGASGEVFNGKSIAVCSGAALAGACVNHTLSVLKNFQAAYTCTALECGVGHAGARRGGHQLQVLFSCFMQHHLCAGVYNGKPVAVKIFLPGASPDGSTTEEIAITCHNIHPHLTRVLAVVVDDNIVDDDPASSPHNTTAGQGSSDLYAHVKGLVMELVVGKTMADRPTSQHLLRCK